MNNVVGRVVGLMVASYGHLESVGLCRAKSWKSTTAEGKDEHSIAYASIPESLLSEYPLHAYDADRLQQDDEICLIPFQAFLFVNYYVEYAF